MTAPPVCEKCHRPLRDELSKRRKYGPVCFRREFGPPAPKPRAGTVRTAGNARPADHRPVDPNQIPLPLEVSTVDAETRKQAIDTVARHALHRHLSYVTSAGAIDWGDYPRIDEDDWESVLNRVSAIGENIAPRDEQYEAAYEHLTGVTVEEGGAAK